MWFSVVWTLIDNGKLANQIARLAAIVVKTAYGRFTNVNREVKLGVNGRRQTAKITSDFEFFSSNP